MHYKFKERLVCQTLRFGTSKYEWTITEVHSYYGRSLRFYRWVRGELELEGHPDGRYSASLWRDADGKTGAAFPAPRFGGDRRIGETMWREMKDWGVRYFDEHPEKIVGE